MATAAETILPVVSAALCTSFAWQSQAYRARVGFSFVVVRRSALAGVAEIAIDGDSRSEEGRMVASCLEALRAAGFAPSRLGSTISVNWTAARAAA